MSIAAKKCTKCKQPKPLSEFYERSGMSGKYQSQCIECYKARGKTTRKTDLNVSTVPGENLVLTELWKRGIPAQPGKTNANHYIDVIAWGCVRIEVKCGTWVRGEWKFTLTPKQQQCGFLADLVVLVCDHLAAPTFHVFEPSNEVFYIEGKYGRALKSALTFRPGQVEQVKHHETRVKLTQPVMDAAQDRWDRVEEVKQRESQKLIERFAHAS